MGKTMKKILCSLLVVVMCLTSAPLQGFVGLELPDFSEWFSSKVSATDELATTGQCGDDVYWDYNSETGGLVISGTGAMTNYYRADASPFYYSSIKSVIVEDGVTTIGDYAFSCCDSLTGALIGNDITIIGWNAFRHCDNLKNVTIGDSVTTIEHGAFEECSNLTNIIIPNSVTSIDSFAFWRCINLRSVTLSKNITYIGDYVFDWCLSLSVITLPYGLKFIGSYAFSCICIPNIDIPKSVTTISDYAFAYCDSLTSVTIPDSVTTIGNGAFNHCDNLKSITIGDGIINVGDDVFEYCDNLTEIYFKGSPDKWINIAYNCGIPEKTIVYYNSTGPDDADINNSNNPDTPDKPNEEPRDFSDYEVDSGKLEEVIYGVDSNGNECITEVVINGKKYNIKRNAETFIGLSDNSIQNELNKNVAFAVLDGEIVMLIPVGSMSKDDITSHIQDDIGLYCGYGEMYSEEDYNRGFKWSEPDENNIVYAIYEAFNPNKELHLSTYLIQKDFYVMPTHQEFDYELKEYLESQIPEAQVHIDKIQLKLRNTKAISFNGKDTYTINVNADIKSNQTLNHFIPIVVKDEYEIPEDKSVELVLFDIVITGERNGEKVEFTNTENIQIRNCDYVEPVKDKNNSKPTKRQYAKDAAARLDGLTGAITLTGLLELFSSEELEYIGNVILAEIAMAETPKDTLEQYLSTKVIDGLFSIDSKFIKFSSKDEIEFTVAGDTKYGEIKLKLICKYSKAYFSGSEFCFTGSVDYEVIGGKGASKLPSSYKNGGLAGMFSSVDMQSFCESAYKLFECHLQKGVDQVWGNDVDGAADLIFGTIVNEILAETELESVSNIAFEIMAKPGKSVLINCPVDVYVYNADNELVAAVVGNEVIQTDEKAQITVDGDIKKVVLLDDSYSIVYRAIADGEMKITVEEYGTSGGLLNSSTISEIPLIAGRKYTQSIDNDFMEESEYTVTSASGNDYVPDKGYSTLAGHDYISGIIKEATCQENGKLINTCSKCGDTYTETISATGHTFDGSKCTSCGYDKADECDCNCHASGIKKFFFKLILFFQKLFKKNAVCACGVAHY